MNTLLKDFKNQIEKYESIGDIEKIRESLASLIELRETNTRYHKTVAAALGRLDARQEAYEAYSIAAEIKEDPGLFALRGMLSIRMGNFEDALHDFQKSNSIDKRSSWRSVNTQYSAYCAAKLGNSKQSLEFLSQLRALIGETEYVSGMISYCGEKITNQKIEKLALDSR